MAGCGVGARRAVVLAAATATIAPAAGLGQTVWIEAEKPARAAVSRHPGWYDQVKKDLLSGGDWISNWSADKDGEVEYAFQAPAEGSYTFWLRANPVATKLACRLDRGAWTPIDMSRDVIDTVNVAADDKPDLRFIAWKRVGDVKLAKGRHAIAFRMSSENNRHGAIDAFVFTAEPFLPDGKARPGAKKGSQGGATGWPFLPARDAFDAKARFDLRGLNEKVAGQSGFVRLGPDGESFVLGDGTPARFWAATTYAQRGSDEDLAHHARFLAKRGVNMVRLHGAMEPKGKDAKLTDVDPKAVDQAWRLVAAMKKEGIYTTISPYWAAALKRVPASWEIEGWPEGQDAQALLFFNPKLQEGYRAWLKALLAPPNPYTGIPLAKDPAVAIIQLQNEDSMLFWTMQAVKGRQLEYLGERFGEWLAKKYGSLDRAKAAWDGDAMDGDDLARGKVGLHIVWEWTQPRAGGRKKRLDDQLQFYGETMHRFNAETARYLREELGCQQLVNAGNWRTADATRLDDVERWSYTANDVIATNRYYDTVHVGPDVGWRINKGDHFQDVSALLNPSAFPLNLKQPAGRPMMVTESHWVPPLGYLAEAPFLVSAYQSLTGIDAFYWFGVGEPEWSNADRADWDAASRKKWAVDTPMELGQFPAVALAYRKGYIREGKPVVVEHRPLKDLWERAIPLISEDPAFDPNRDSGDAPRRSDVRGKVDPLAFLAGPVKVAFGSDARDEVADLSRLIDPRKQVVQSVTGELAWDFGRGVCTVDAPSVQGACGFLKQASPIKLKDATLDVQNDYAAVTIVALDDLPLATSRKVLVQVGTVARPSGWTEREAEFTGGDGKTKYKGKQVIDTGKMPWMIIPSQVIVTLANPNLATAAALDPNGVPTGDVKVDRSGPALKVMLPKDALYVVLEAR
ncbi:MAG: hypothetical protein BGO49_27510 [Planctomycetales bacterium 71-10]|nr:MAG: hypothetical protein BGO49_27510 [Planctomycetales bacterium 71-10]